MKKIKRRLHRVIAGAAAFAAAMSAHLLLDVSENVTIMMFLAVLFIVGGDVIQNAVKNILKGQVFDEQFLMSIAAICAFLVGEYPEGAAVMLFYQVGELFQSYAVYHSRKSIKDLMDIRPDYATVLRDGREATVSPQEVEPGEIILVKPGEKVPLDGEVIEGFTTLDTKALTGESVPREAAVGQQVLSGCVNITGSIKVKVTASFAQSTVSKILDLVENQGNRKARTENFITRFARYYTPAVVGIAVLVAVLPCFFYGFDTFSTWLYRAMIFLVLSCPCALVISVPLSFFGGLGGASRQGILVKGGNFLEAAAEMQTVVFDKTGTLTKGSFSVCEVRAKNGSEEEVLELAAGAEQFSNHPIAISLREAVQKKEGKKLDEVTNVTEEPGFGVTAVIRGAHICVGNARLMEREGIAPDSASAVGTIVHVSADGVYKGWIAIADEPKEDAGAAIVRLKQAGIRQTVMLTGDNPAIGEAIGAQLGLDLVYAGLLPHEKVEKLEKILGEKKMAGDDSVTAYVGDGVNDAPVLARADIGIAMGGLGSDAAIEAADIVIMTDEPSKIADVIAISRKTLRIARENIVFALGVKLLVLFLGLFGIATMWMSVFADVGVAFLAILNAMRTMKKR